jgi:coatomer subunit beta'
LQARDINEEDVLDEMQDETIDGEKYIEAEDSTEGEVHVEMQDETIDGEKYVEAEDSTEGEVLVNGNEAEEEWGMDNEGNQRA